LRGGALEEKGRALDGRGDHWIERGRALAGSGKYCMDVGRGVIGEGGGRALDMRRRGSTEVIWGGGGALEGRGACVREKCEEGDTPLSHP